MARMDIILAFRRATAEKHSSKEKIRLYTQDLKVWPPARKWTKLNNSSDCFNREVDKVTGKSKQYFVMGYKSHIILLQEKLDRQ